MVPITTSPISTAASVFSTLSVNLIFQYTLSDIVNYFSVLLFFGVFFSLFHLKKSYIIDYSNVQ